MTSRLQYAQDDQGTRLRWTDDAVSLLDAPIISFVREAVHRVVLDRQDSLVSSLPDTERDWLAIAGLVRQNKLTPIVSRYLKLVDLDVPPKFRDQVNDDQKKVARRTAMLLLQSRRVHSAFDEAGIPVLVLKGAALACGVFGDIGLRQFNDLDLLVAPDDIPRARRLLVSLGYEWLLAAELGDDTTFFEQEQELLHMSRATEYEMSSGGGSIDLHWGTKQLETTVARKAGTASRLFKNAVPCTVRDQELRTFCPEHTLIHSCVHATWHACLPLSLLVDVAACLFRAESLDWEKVKTEALAMGLHRRLAVGLAVAGLILDLPLPEQAAAIVRETPGVEPNVQVLLQYIQERWHDISGVHAAFEPSARFQLGLEDRWMTRLSWLQLTAFMPGPREFRRYRIPYRRRFLYTILRPLSILLRRPTLKGNPPWPVPRVERDERLRPPPPPCRNRYRDASKSGPSGLRGAGTSLPARSGFASP